MSAATQPLGSAEAFLNPCLNNVIMSNKRELARIRGFSASVVAVADLTWPRIASMLGRALGATHTVVLAIAVASAASELPADFKKTMNRWMVSEDAERSPLSVRAPEAPADVFASAATLAGVLGRSGGQSSTLSIGSEEAQRPIGPGTIRAVHLWLQMRSHAKEAFLPPFDTISAGPPHLLNKSGPSDGAVSALLIFGHSEQNTHE